MLKTELEVVKIGKPDIATLPEGEQRAFFETLYARVLELAKENNKDNSILYCQVRENQNSRVAVEL